MAKRNITAHGLLNYHKQIQQMSGTIYAEFFAPKIQEFYRSNGIRVNTISARVEALRTTYFEIDENGKTISFTGEDGKSAPKLKDGLTMEEYNKLLTKLLNTIIAID